MWSAEVPCLSDLSTLSSWQERVCLLWWLQSSLSSDLCATVRESEGCVGCTASWGALMSSWGKWLNWIHLAREDLRICKYVFFEIYMLSESHVWYVHGFTGMLPQKAAISQENISHLLKNTRNVFKLVFSTITIDMDHMNAENRINSRHLPSLPCHVCSMSILFSSPRYFPLRFRGNESRNSFAGCFVLFCCPFQYVRIINFSLTWSLWDSSTFCKHKWEWSQ